MATMDDILPNSTRSVTATLIKDWLRAWNGHAALWKLSAPVSYVRGKRDIKTDHVIISAAGDETYIFPATAEGDCISLVEMRGSIKGTVNHWEAIRRAGWKVAA